MLQKSYFNIVTGGKVEILEALMVWDGRGGGGWTKKSASFQYIAGHTPSLLNRHLIGTLRVHPCNMEQVLQLLG